MTVPRRRSTLRELQASASDGDVVIPKVIDARPSLEKAEMYGIDDPRPASSRMMALVGRIFIETIPQWLTVGAMMALIFGGCCSNVSGSLVWEDILEKRLMIGIRSLHWRQL
jgi:UDP-xylose/UDP-N-acetylglucosamine transporter B4